VTDPDAHLAESRDLARMLILSAERVRADFAEAVAPFGIPVPLARALLVVATPTPMRELAGQLACDPSYVTGIADQLEAGGLVTRVPGKDRRVKLLVVTERGAELREQLAEAVTQQSVLGQKLDPRQREDLAGLLRLLLGPDGGIHEIAPQHPLAADPIAFAGKSTS